ncbi:flagellar motor switch protein FliG [Leifsonia sp. Leaf264]|uniref:flagellar motor switch protein FliG n=1 Tax=Leifsonia sp. Leaf264 TaxID=1736314 RepID=UPI0006FF0747|nr:flagellar motor switch protein FliG [Leifsonia sp. Leaf264]KQO98233.1 flagellar motor switch protein FliG [Leifsonia sp. Leaf264]
MSTIKNELTGPEKTAIILMNLDSDAAAGMLQELSEEEHEEIASAIVRMQKVSADVTEAVLDDFYALALDGRVGARGGKDKAEELLSLALGGEKAAGLMHRVTNSMAGRSFEFLYTVDPGQVAALLEGELPQTIALVMVHLPSAHASNIMSELRDPLRTDIAECIAETTSATPEAISAIASSLKSRAAAVVGTRSQAEVVGGVQPLVDIINRAPVETEKAVLAGLDLRNPALAEEIRSKLLTFLDIIKLEARDVQQVLRGIDAVILATAMKGAPDPVQQKIRENLSERNRELLDDELDAMGPIRQSQVEEARAEIVRAIRGLEEQGAITVHRGDEDGFVD